MGNLGKEKADSNLRGLASLDDTGSRRFFGHIFAPYFKCLYFLFERGLIKIDVDPFYFTYLRMIERTDLLDGFSKGRKVRTSKAYDAFCRLDPEFRLELYIVVEQCWVNVPAIPGGNVIVQPGKTEQV